MKPTIDEDGLPGMDGLSDKSLMVRARVTMLMEAILDCLPPEGCPSGTIYAALMSQVGLELYQEMLNTMKRQGSVRVTAHYVMRGPNYEAVLGAMRRIIKKVEAELKRRKEERCTNGKP